MNLELRRMNVPAAPGPQPCREARGIPLRQHEHKAEMRDQRSSSAQTRSHLRLGDLKLCLAIPVFDISDMDIPNPPSLETRPNPLPRHPTRLRLQSILRW